MSQPIRTGTSVIERIAAAAITHGIDPLYVGELVREAIEGDWPYIFTDTTFEPGVEARFAAIDALVHEWQPDALVVGVPFHPDGAAHENTLRARRFGRQLHGRFHLPVNEVDERYTSTEALADGAADIDAASAALILEQFLRQLT